MPLEAAARNRTVWVTGGELASDAAPRRCLRRVPIRQGHSGTSCMLAATSWISSRCLPKSADPPPGAWRVLCPLVFTLLVPLSQCVPGAEIVGPAPPQRTDEGTRVVQGEPPLVRLTLRGENSESLDGKIVRWIGPIGEGQIAEVCEGALHVSTAVPGDYEFLAVIVPSSVSSPDDIEIVRHRFRVERRAAPAPPVTPQPPPPVEPPAADLTAQARLWLQSVPQPARVRARDVAETLREIAGSTSIRTIDEMELFLRLGLAWSIGDAADAWSSFSTAANGALDALKRTGATPQQYASALRQIAAGLE